jgi:O-methyltransferase involved in polyketide biosynthesis
MTDDIKHDVSGTAFVVNYSRAKMVHISQDRYAHLWVTPEAISLWNEVARDVYPNDDLNMSLRNRFYLEHIKKFVAANQDGVIISIAAGFDNYPFLLETDYRFIEVDLPNIIDYKRAKVLQWMKEDILPKRNVDFVSIDLTKYDQRIKLKEGLQGAIAQKPSLAMMEGLTYYLPREVLSDIFDLLAEVQPTGSLVVFDYWKPDALQYPVMQRLAKYLNHRFGESSAEWHLFDECFINEIKGYTAMESSDIAGLELKYSDTRLFQGRDDKIPVHFSVLIKR